MVQIAAGGAEVDPGELNASQIESEIASAVDKLQPEHSEIESEVASGIGLLGPDVSEIESKVVSAVQLISSEIVSAAGGAWGLDESCVLSEVFSELQSKVGSGIEKLESEIEASGGWGTTESVVQSWVISELQSKIASTVTGGGGWGATESQVLSWVTSEVESKIVSNIEGPLLLTNFESQLGSVRLVPVNTWTSVLEGHADYPMRIKAFGISYVGMSAPSVRITVDGTKRWPFSPSDEFLNGVEEVLDETMDIPECMSYALEVSSISTLNASVLAYLKYIELMG